MRTVFAILVLAIPASAAAEGPQPQPQPQPVMTPVYAQPAAQHPAPEPEPAPETAATDGRGIQYGASLIVPVFLEPDLGLDPGVGFQLRVGWEFPSGFNLEIGYQMAFHGGQLGLDDVDATIWGLSLGGRFAFLNASALVPFIAAGAGLGIYGFEWGSSSSSTASPATVDLYAGVGAQYEISAQVGIDVGVRFVYAFAGEVEYFGGDGQFLVVPFAGLTLYL